MPEDYNQAIKAVVSGSAADIIKAMHQDKQSTVENASLLVISTKIGLYSSSLRKPATPETYGIVMPATEKSAMKLLKYIA